MYNSNDANNVHGKPWYKSSVLKFCLKGKRKKKKTVYPVMLEATSAFSKMVLQGPPRIPPKGRTFSVQYNLPRLPVPALESTLQKYLDSCKPLLDDDQFANTQKIVQQFLTNEGPKLQSLLEKRADTHISWLSDWWKNVAYLDYRLPVVVNVSPALVVFKQDYQGPKEQLDFAARCIAGALDFKMNLDDQAIPVESLGGKPLCMYQYYTLLGACRIPGTKRDSHYVTQQGDPDSPRHINVIHNNYIFSVEVFDQEGKPLNAAQIREQLQTCVDQSRKPGTPVGLLTSMDRSSWGSVYNSMSKDKVNKSSFDNIKRSLFVVNLDGPMPKSDLSSIDNWTGMLLHGGGSSHYSGNRWFDKTIQVAFSPEGYCGITYEHTSAEGPIIISLIDHMISFAQRNQEAWMKAPETQVPKRLQFNVADKVKNIINQAKDEIDSAVDDLMICSIQFKEYGKKFIKSQKLSPDAFMQLAFQLAYYRIYQKPCATYESGSLRRFQLGRTDTIRSCTNASLAFTTAMEDNSVTTAEKERLLRQAVAAHRKYTDDVVTGQGIDRHLLGLKLTALEQGMNVPELFMDLAYQEMTHFRLSTSQVAGLHTAFLAFGPVVPDGYGICYNPQEDYLNYVVTSYNNSPKTDSIKMAEGIQQGFRDIHSLLMASHTKAKL